VIRLRRGDRKRLEGWLRTRTTPQRQVERAEIVLGSADGLSSYELAERLGLSRPTVQRWLDRYEAEGIQGLEDRSRSGRPRTVTPEVVEEVIEMTTQDDPPEGTHWSTRIMAEEVGLHHSQVARIWRAHGLKPHLIKTFKLSGDPDFLEKLRDVVGLYLAPPERAIVFAFDEKSQIQALDRTQPGLPLKKGRAGTMTHDYKRHGTTTLFAALDVATGEVIHECLPRHRHQEFLRFLRKVEAETDPELDLHFILDNYAAHKHANVEAWLEKTPARALPLHPDLVLLAQPRRAALRRAHRAPDPTPRRYLRRRTRGRDPRLPRSPQRVAPTLCLDRLRRGHNHQSPEG